MACQSALLCCLLPVVVWPQTSTFKTDVNLRLLNVRVVDSRGNPVLGLSATSFSLLEDNVPQRITFFAAENEPISLGILLDTSSSMRVGGKIERARTALDRLIAAGRPDNELFLLEFGTTLGDIVPLNKDKQLTTGVLSATVGRSGTALYDAIAVALCRLRIAQNKRQALIVITDGADQHSRLKISELIRIVQSSPAQVYIVGNFSTEENDVFQSRNDRVMLVSGRQIDNPVLVFERLARESGAECYFPITNRALNRAIAAIESAVQTQYTLGYYPQPSGKLYRHTQVKVLRRGVKVQTRQGFSMADAGAYFSVNGCAISVEDHPLPYESKLRHVGKRLVYQEDFLDPQSGWPFSSSSWYGTGGYHIVRTGPATPYAEGSVCAYGPWWNDVDVSLSLRLSAVGLNESSLLTVPAAGLVFRLNELGYYALLISGSQGLQAKMIAKPFKSLARDVLPWTPLPGTQPNSINRWNKLRVACRGNAITLYVNDRVLVSVRDGSFTDGYVGMTLFGTGEAVFRNLIAQELE